MIFSLEPGRVIREAAGFGFPIQQPNDVLAGVAADFAKLIQDRLFPESVAFAIALLDDLQIGSSFVFSHGGNPLDFGYTQCEATTPFLLTFWVTFNFRKFAPNITLVFFY